MTSIILWLIGEWKTVWTVKADSPFKKWTDLVDWAKKNSGQLTFGHCTASSFYFGMVMIAKREGLLSRGFPLACDAPTMTALLGGHVMPGWRKAPLSKPCAATTSIRILLAARKDQLREGHGSKPHSKTCTMISSASPCHDHRPKGVPDNVKKRWRRPFTEGMKSDVFKKAG